MKSLRWPWVLLLALVPLLGWWSTGLFDIDEGFYAAVASEMNRRGEWITPFYNGRTWFEKPILTYWAMKPALWAFGEMIGPRLPSVLATIGSYALVGWFARRRWGNRAAIFSVLVMASSLLVVAVGRLAMTDSLLLLTTSGAFLLFWESLEGDPRWRLASAALLGAGVLAKGPVAILLFVPLAVYTYFACRQLRPRFSGYWTRGTAILLLVVAAWYLPAWLANRETFVQEFLIEQNLNRFTGGDEAHTLDSAAAFIFYVPIFVLGFFPWSLLLLISTFSKRTGKTGDVEKFLWAWLAVVFLFFTISGAKLPHYILPLAPPVALLVGRRLALGNRESAERKLVATGVWVVIVAAIAIIGIQIWYRQSGHAEIHALAKWVRAQAPQNVASYQMPRRQKALGTGKLKIQETSHPSLVFYLDQRVLQTDEFSRLLNAPKPLYILTRWNRISDEDVLAAHEEGYTLRRADTPSEQDLYAVWILESRS